MKCQQCNETVDKFAMCACIMEVPLTEAELASAVPHKVGDKQPTLGFKKNDNGKLRWHLMPWEALEEVMKVLESGATVYGEFNWIDQSDDAKWSRLMNSRDRHIRKFDKGVEVDAESGHYELAHAIANCLFLLTYQMKSKGIDDRRKS